MEGGWAFFLSCVLEEFTPVFYFTILLSCCGITTNLKGPVMDTLVWRWGEDKKSFLIQDSVFNMIVSVEIYTYPQQLLLHSVNFLTNKTV